MKDEVPLVVYLASQDRFVVRNGNRWDLDLLLTEKALRKVLISMGLSKKKALEFIANDEAHKVARRMDLAPNKPMFFENDDGLNVLNTWIPPKLNPKAAEYPTIERVIQHLTRGDPEGAAWLTNWMAYKVQNPEGVPKVAIVFATAQGGGKGFLALVLRHILGLENTTVVKQSELENKFNSRWINKLFVLGDEILSNENMRDISQKLKILIDGGEQELEGKGKDQFVVRSRLAWMFASNDRTTPVVLEDTDRRYSIFNNYDPVPEDYKAQLEACFGPDRSTPTAAFFEEIAGFYAYLLEVKVDLSKVFTPYRNQAREGLIIAARPSHEQFIVDVEEHGIEYYLKPVMDRDFALADSKESWDFEDKGISGTVLYKAYVDYSKAAGLKPLKRSKFLAALSNTPPYWEKTRPSDPKTHKRVWCYKVPRSTQRVNSTER